MRSLYGLYLRWAGTGSVRASSNPLVRLAARGGLPAANDLATAEAQIAALPERLNVPAVDEAWYRATYPDVGGREPYLHFAGLGRRELCDPGSGRSTQAALLRVCGFRPARATVEDTGWLGAIGTEPVERAAPLEPQVQQAGQMQPHFSPLFRRKRSRTERPIRCLRHQSPRQRRALSSPTYMSYTP